MIFSLCKTGVLDVREPLFMYLARACRTATEKEPSEMLK